MRARMHVCTVLTGEKHVQQRHDEGQEREEILSGDVGLDAHFPVANGQSGNDEDQQIRQQITEVINGLQLIVCI